MLTVRPDQTAIGIATERSFVDWYVDTFMPEELPHFHEALSDTSLREMVGNGRRRAIGYGFSDPRCQAQFVTLMWVAGPRFADFPGFAEIAADTASPESERIDAFYAVDPALAAEAIVRADDSGWFSDGGRP
jgi:hypothetical protein